MAKELHESMEKGYVKKGKTDFSYATKVSFGFVTKTATRSSISAITIARFFRSMFLAPLRPLRALWFALQRSTTKDTEGTL